ncbi:YicC/YloC family endoribonuclease [Paenirhodobacter populi]|uniref:YicC/YloC family endoribonuclease n=1 Tax=Paenirhodobacter populi TaxID=2306993 RepID=UPI000FE3FF31|nr:YicC/YloC family endoribonuclease [Sinirhodobacter populi]RWR05012.1 YicC family protein [Sinirhodobacter populi]
MTGFAARQGAGAGHDWMWDMRSVNGKGLDLKLRLPDVEGLEAAVRAAVAGVAARGNISVTLRLSRAKQAEVLRLSPEGLRGALAAVAAVGQAAAERGMELAPTRATDILALRGVIETAPPEIEDPDALRIALLADLDGLLHDFSAMRRAEGGRIGTVIAGQVERIAQLTEEAAVVAEARRPEAAAALQAALARVAPVPGADPQRVAQELALIAVRADVTEELDRLRAHVAAARALLVQGGPIGRKFDFLTQEFVREANTLCSKSGSTRLTAIGLDLKHAIDQMREQIQNVE